jgi:hypothetical protein
MHKTRSLLFGSLVSGALGFVLGPRFERLRDISRGRRVVQSGLRGSAAFADTPCRQELRDCDKTTGSAADDEHRRAT